MFVLHVVVGVVLLAAVASVAAFVATRVARDQTRREPVAASEVVASRIVAPLITQDVYDGDGAALQALNDRVLVRKAGSTIQRVKVWSRDGVVLYSDDPRTIGLTYPLSKDQVRVLASSGVESTVTDLSGSQNVLDRLFGESLEVSVGTEDATGRPILVQTFYPVDRLDADEATLVRRVVTVVLAAMLGFGLLLVPLAYSLARRAARASGPPPASGSSGPGGPR
jgi:two-component system, NarL family, sensor kinase